MEPKLNHVETGREVNRREWQNNTVHITKHKPDHKIVSLLLAYMYIYIYIKQLVLILESDWQDTFSVDISPACSRRVSVSAVSLAVRDCLWVGHRSFNYTFKNADSFQICNVIMICKAAEIILTLSATFKGSADQQSVDVKRQISLSLNMTTCFHKYTWLRLKDRLR